MTPIERDDLAVMVEMVDTVVDSLDDTLMKMYMYDPQTVRPEVNKFCKLICISADTLQDVAAELSNFRKSKTMDGLLLKLQMYEEDADGVYMNAMASLYRDRELDPVQVLVWNNIFEALEQACDDMEELSSIIGRVIMKNI